MIDPRSMPVLSAMSVQNAMLYNDEGESHRNRSSSWSLRRMTNGLSRPVPRYSLQYQVG